MTTLTARPSGSAVWLACPMGLTMQNRYGNRYPAGAAAEEGTAAHWVKEQLRAGNPVSVGDAAPNGVAVDDDMIYFGERANAYIDRFANGGQVFTERKLVAKLPGFEIRGTTDDMATVAIDNDRRLHIFDYKYGFVHVPADAGQIKLYGVAARQEFQIEKITLHIIQPRDYSSPGERSFDFTPALQNEFCDEVVRALKLAHVSKPYALAGTHCRNCPGRGAHCSGNWDSAISSMEELTRPIDNSPEAIGKMVRLMREAHDVVTAALKGVEDEARFLLESGTPVPGWSMGSTRGREKWTGEAEVLALAEGFGLLDTVSERRLITPNQAIKAGLPAELVRMHTTRPQGEAKLVPTGETLAARVFGGGQ